MTKVMSVYYPKVVNGCTPEDEDYDYVFSEDGINFLQVINSEPFRVDVVEAGIPTRTATEYECELLSLI